MRPESPDASAPGRLLRLEPAILLAPGGLLLLAAGLLLDAAAEGAFVRSRGAPVPVAAALSLVALAILLIRPRRLWRARLVLALLAACLALLAPWAHRRHVAELRAAAEGPARQALLGRPAPVLDWMFAINLTPDQEARIRDPQGRILLVDFWATWCGPCVEHMPRLESLHREVSDGLLVVGVTTFYDGDYSPQGVSAELQRIRAFAERLEITYPIVITADTTVHDRYHVESLPTSALIDRAGHILDYGIGVVGTGEVFEHTERLLY